LEIFDLDGHNLGTVLNDRFPATSAYRKKLKQKSYCISKKLVASYSEDL
jgi:hypothetical protein